MTNEKFQIILDKRLNSIQSVLASKATEYATSSDRLHNFNRAAQILGIDRRSALTGMLSKHLVSILDIVDNFENIKPSFEMIEEKIGDAINYLILLEAMLKEDVEQLITINEIMNDIDKKLERIGPKNGKEAHI
jgi:hypothetical protein